MKKKIGLVLLSISLLNPLGGVFGEPLYPEDPEKPEDVDQPVMLEESIGYKLDLDYLGAYMEGYADGSFKPDKELTRGEFASIIYRLMRPEYVGTINDVSSDLIDIENHWAREEIETLYNGGFLVGYSDKTFRPDKAISRGELATILARIDRIDADYDNLDIIDIEGHWAETSIREVISKELFESYDDRNFKPDQGISRLDFVVLVNGILNRTEKDFDESLDMIDFKDVDYQTWYYEEIALAVN